MLRFFIILVFSCFVYKSFCQDFNPPLVAFEDSTTKKEFFLRPFFDFSMLGFTNEKLKEQYATDFIFCYSFGIQLNHSLEQSLFPYVSFSQASYTALVKTQLISETHTFLMQQISCGFLLKMLKMNRTSMLGKLAYTQSVINESVYSVNHTAYGFLFGVGLERRLGHKTKCYAEYTYNFQKIEPWIFRDFDNTRVSFGICF